MPRGDNNQKAWFIVTRSPRTTDIEPEFMSMKKKQTIDDRLNFFIYVLPKNFPMVITPCRHLAQFTDALQSKVKAKDNALLSWALKPLR